MTFIYIFILLFILLLFFKHTNCPEIDLNNIKVHFHIDSTFPSRNYYSNLSSTVMEQPELAVQEDFVDLGVNFMNFS
jgi:hypothetical protein